MLRAFLCMEGALCWRRWELQQTWWDRPPLPWPAPGDPLGLGEGSRGVLSGRAPLQCHSWEVSRIGATFPSTHQALRPPQWPFSELAMGGVPWAEVKGGRSPSLCYRR